MPNISKEYFYGLLLTFEKNLFLFVPNIYSVYFIKIYVHIGLVNIPHEVFLLYFHN